DPENPDGDGETTTPGTDEGDKDETTEPDTGEEEGQDPVTPTPEPGGGDGETTPTDPEEPEAEPGTIDNPIEYNNSMALVQGTYYTQGGVVYLCTRDTIIPVYNDLAD